LIGIASKVDFKLRNVENETQKGIHSQDSEDVSVSVSLVPAEAAFGAQILHP
jgi:hypothetical protein